MKEFTLQSHNKLYINLQIGNTVKCFAIERIHFTKYYQLCIAIFKIHSKNYGVKIRPKKIHFWSRYLSQLCTD